MECGISTDHLRSSCPIEFVEEQREKHHFAAIVSVPNLKMTVIAGHRWFSFPILFDMLFIFSIYNCAMFNKTVRTINNYPMFNKTMRK